MNHISIPFHIPIHASQNWQLQHKVASLETAKADLESKYDALTCDVEVPTVFNVASFVYETERGSPGVSHSEGKNLMFWLVAVEVWLGVLDGVVVALAGRGQPPPHPTPPTKPPRPPTRT